MKTLLLGAVSYDPKVVPIWDIIRDYSNEWGLKLDYVLFSNYERQVQSLLAGHIDIAWNTNVAWIRTLHKTQGKAKALVMRDTDKNFTTKFIARKGSGIKDLQDLKGKRFGLGSLDSAQAAILGLYYLQQAKIAPNIVEFDSPDVCGRGTNESKSTKSDNSSLSVVRFNSDLGKHGDTGRSEFDVLDAIKRGELDAGSIGSSTWIRILSEGSYPEIESFWNTPGYCHCNFSVLPSLESSAQEAFCEMLLSQNEKKSEPLIAKMMQMEGLNEWIRVSEAELRNYDVLQKAMEEQNLL